MSLTPLGLGSFKDPIVLKYLLNSVLKGLAKITQPLVTTLEPAYYVPASIIPSLKCVAQLKNS